MKLYFFPGACSIGIHVLLEEIGKPYETVKIDLRAGEHFKPDYLAVNPKHKVPALQRDDGSILTEFPAIAYWLAATNPQAGLLPPDPDHAARALEFTDYIVSTMHMQGFQRIFRPAAFTPNAADEEKIRARGHEIFAEGFSFIDPALAGNEYLVGRYSFADAALFYVCFWAVASLKMTLPTHCAAHYARMRARPAVGRVLQAEGFPA
jgi:glutathione S-transferase